MSEQPVTYDGQDVKAKAQGVSLYERDMKDIERIRQHYGLDNFSQAIRRAVRVTVKTVEDEQMALAS